MLEHVVCNGNQIKANEFEQSDTFLDHIEVVEVELPLYTEVVVF